MILSFLSIIILAWKNTFLPVYNDISGLMAWQVSEILPKCHHPPSVFSHHTHLKIIWLLVLGNREGNPEKFFSHYIVINIGQQSLASAQCTSVMYCQLLRIFLETFPVGCCWGPVIMRACECCDGRISKSGWSLILLTWKMFTTFVVLTPDRIFFLTKWRNTYVVRWK